MKKLALLFLAILVLGVLAVYYFIPNTLVVTAVSKANCVSDAAFRRMSDEQSWNQWWPGGAGSGTAVSGAGLSRMGKYNYILSKKVINNFEILIESDKDTLKSEMNLLSIPHDSTLIKWQFTMPAGNNIFKRIAAYSKAAGLKNDMNAILNNLQPYLSNFSNLYGFALHESSTKDTMILTTKSFSAVYPTTDFVYKLVGKLKNYSSTRGAMITGMPMLNVTEQNPSGYYVMAGLPIDRVLESKDSVIMVKMVPGKFIITDVTGGTKTVEQAHQQIHYYFQDYRRITMAIPFEYLLTDRQKEKDTSKWLTRIYSPVY